MITGSDQHILGYLREVCAAAQGLQSLLSSANAAAEGKNAGERAPWYASALTEANVLREHAQLRIDGSTKGIREIFLADAEAHDWCADYVVRIEGAMTMIGANWPGADKSPDEMSDAFRRAIV